MIIPMWLPIFLSVLGLVLVYLEFFLPGGLIAIIGGFSLVAGVTIFSTLEVAPFYKILYFVATAMFTATACRSAIWVLRTRKSQEMVLQTNQEGFFATGVDDQLIGQEGSAATDLKPSGHILIGEKRYQALSDGNYIQKNTPIIILSAKGSAYTVKEVLSKDGF